MDKTKLEQLTENYPLHPSKPEEIPPPTFWPIMTAFSVMFFAWGFITSIIITGVGFVGMGISIAGWIEELRNG